jgi:hypothetical protein
MIVERVLPQQVSTSDADRDAMRSDLQMLLGCDGRERTEAEFGTLLRLAGLQPRSLTRLTNDFSVIEAAIA